MAEKRGQYAYLDDGTVAQLVQIAANDTQGIAIQPVDIQKRYAETIQTHNAVSVPLNGNSTSSWVDCEGFDKIAVSLMNDASIGSRMHVWWSTDGISVNGKEIDVVSTGALQHKSVELPTKLRYAKIEIINTDATLAHTISTFVYLKA